jgi:predicted DsbA family dithiol-disulfide isomerase
LSKPIEVFCFTDVLCVWAYVSQIRIDELHAQWGDKVHIQQRFINVFGSTAHRIGEGWHERGSYAGFGQHVLQVCEQFPHVEINGDIWQQCRPLTSGNAHLLLKAVQLLQAETSPGLQDDKDTPFARMAWQIRLAFFRDAQDIGDLRVLLALAEQQGLPVAELERLLGNGAAIAALARDSELCEQHHLAGSPTYLMNEGRQKLYGNVGYRILDANVRELWERPHIQASWC